MNIADFISTQSALDDLIRSTLKEYHSHEDYAPIRTWDEVAGYINKSKDMDEHDDIDQVLSAGVVQKLFRKHHIPYTERTAKANNKQIVYYVKCPWSDNHTTEANATESFISVSTNGMINYHCNHNHCDDKRWQDYKNYYEDRAGTGARDQAQKSFNIDLVSGRDLQSKELPPIVYPVAEMIPEGYTVFSAPFKYGKSWFALELCLAVAKGTEFLGMRTTKGTAVYMALEDCDKFAQDRLNMVLDGADAPEGFYYIYNQVPTLDDGLIDYMDQLITQLPDLKLIVIDVLAMIEYQMKRGETAYKCDYRTGGTLKKWADDHSVSIVAITHTTKAIHPNDVFMNTTGTNGVTASADAILTIAKESRTAKDGVLAVTGRRVREKYLKVRLNDGYIWETDGEVDPDTMKADTIAQEREASLAEYRKSEIRNAVIKIANVGINKEMSSRDVINMARELDIYLLSQANEVGLFIHKYQNYFFTEDNVKVFVRKRGTASNLYKFTVWETADAEGDDPETIFCSSV